MDFFPISTVQASCLFAKPPPLHRLVGSRSPAFNLQVTALRLRLLFIRSASLRSCRLQKSALHHTLTGPPPMSRPELQADSMFELRAPEHQLPVNNGSMSLHHASFSARFHPAEVVRTRPVNLGSLSPEARTEAETVTSPM